MFNPVELYSLAVYLHYNPGNLPNAVMRTCINRAYYAAFLYARDSAGIRNESGSVHGDVKNHYQTRNRSIFNRLTALLTMRHAADYKLDSTVTSRETGNAIRLSKEILKALGVEEHVEFVPTVPPVAAPQPTPAVTEPATNPTQA